LLALSGTLLNAATVLAGGVLGTALGDRLPAPFRERVVFGVGLFILALGIKFAIDSSNLLYLLGSILIGGIVGTALGIDRRLSSFGDALQRRFAREGRESTISEAFVTASIVFCVGPLTFLGAIQNGLSGDATLLVIKSVLDGFTSLSARPCWRDSCRTCSCAR